MASLQEWLPWSDDGFLTLPASFDAHVHLRDGAMMRAVTRTIRQGGADTVYVMPNLVPPITNVKQALEYQTRLQGLEPNVKFLMTLYLHESITPEVIKEAKREGIRGVKSYPAGVTTNSSSGVVDYASFYPVFAEMERQDLVLNLHGEMPSGKNITILNAEEKFLPTLLELHARFPLLRIVLEHCTTAAAIEAVKSCGPNVVGTITAHHLSLIVDDFAGDSYNYCKPVPKTPEDRHALLHAAASGNSKFFLGTDSAPHPAIAKRGGTDGNAKHAAGVFSQPHATQYVLDAFEIAVEKGFLEAAQLKKINVADFLGQFGRDFYREPRSKQRIRLSRDKTERLTSIVSNDGDIEVVVFRRGELTRSLEWL
ncbi:hypothetical protein MMC11_007954 [Xylographa trunciseda]|nr:hypothetical protein [Xylographa trunciseda]